MTNLKSESRDLKIKKVTQRTSEKTQNYTERRIASCKSEGTRLKRAPVKSFNKFLIQIENQKPRLSAGRRLKSPNSPHMVSVVLRVVELTAIVEVLDPRTGLTDLS